ncbi:MAG: hypothetical protein HQ526_02060 [Actinobacteria bacterium]|nr:hypothetical protein [Actinomycetota bacterium]
MVVGNGAGDAEVRLEVGAALVAEALAVTDGGSELLSVALGVDAQPASPSRSTAEDASRELFMAQR